MTNPDNAGGLPEMEQVVSFLLGEDEIGGHWFGDVPPDAKGKFWWRHFLREAWNRRELCRAAPAGGYDWPFLEEIGRDGKPTGYWVRKGSPAAARMSAPAGSGEVEECDWDAAHEALESMDDYARMDVGVAPHGPYTVLRDLLTKAKGWQEAAALLRKLQQGAE